MTVARPTNDLLTYGPDFVQFCSDFVRHTKGRWAKEPLRLEPFQREFFYELFACDPATGRRYYQEAVWGLPRKNGKTTAVAAFSLYMLIREPEPEPEVYMAAASKDQARIMFRQALRFIDPEVSPPLADEVRARRDYVERPKSGGILRVLSSDAPKQHGLNPSAVVIDELHAHEDPELYAALTTASGARDEPLTLTITTAGWNKATVLGEIYDRAMERTAQLERRPGLTILRDRANGFLFWWHALPDKADPDDPEAWRIANPASWITEDYLRRQRGKPSMRPADMLRLHGNRWTAAEEEWLPSETWEACRDDELELDPELPVAVGVDIALTRDYATAVIAQRQGERTVVRARFWHNPHELGHPEHAAWELEIAEVREYLREVYEGFPAPAAFKPDSKVPAPGPAFAFDPWRFKESAQVLRSEGLNMVEVPQWNKYRVPADTLLYELIREGRIAHDGDEVLAEHIANARGLKTDRGWRIVRPKDHKGRELMDKHIDGAVGLSMAAYQVSTPAPPRPDANRKPAVMSY